MTNDRNSADSPSLCASCGLCCNGLLFGDVALEPGERDRVAALGLPLFEREGATRFRQPCPMLDGDLCRVYADRPSACRTYRCQLLKKHEAGEVSRDEADERVRDTKRLIAELRPLLERRGLHENATSNWQRFFREWRQRPSQARSDPEEAQIVLRLALLNLHLDRHFRSERLRAIDRIEVR